MVLLPGTSPLRTKDGCACRRATTEVRSRSERAKTHCAGGSVLLQVLRSKPRSSESQCLPKPHLRACLSPFRARALQGVPIPDYSHENHVPPGSQHLQRTSTAQDWKDTQNRTAINITHPYNTTARQHGPTCRAREAEDLDNATPTLWTLGDHTHDAERPHNVYGGKTSRERGAARHCQDDSSVRAF